MELSGDSVGARPGQLPATRGCHSAALRHHMLCSWLDTEGGLECIYGQGIGLNLIFIYFRSYINLVEKTKFKVQTSKINI